MKNFISLLLFALSTQAATITVAWDDDTNIGVTYEVHYGPTNATYTNFVASTTKTATLTNLASGARYYMAVRAVGSAGVKSDFSNEINHVTPINNPSGTRVVTQVSQSINGPWIDLATNDMPDGFTFSRGKILLAKKTQMQMPPLPPGFRP